MECVYYERVRAQAPQLTGPLTQLSSHHRGQAGATIWGRDGLGAPHRYVRGGFLFFEAVEGRRSSSSLPRANVPPLCVLSPFLTLLPPTLPSLPPPPRLLSSLSPCLPSSATFIPHLLISPPPPRNRNALQEFLLPFLKRAALHANTVQTRLPSVASPFETRCSLNAARLNTVPSAFL